MKIEAVTTCYQYADFLAESAKWNRGLFDRWVIVTQEDDLETREVCRKYNLETILTQDAAGIPGTWAKGKVIERGLVMLSEDTWRLHLDADMVLPLNFRHAITAAQLEPTHIYGIDRLMVKSWKKWQEVKASGYLHDQHDFHSRVRHLDGVSVGCRWVHPIHGYCPIGCFQLWHSSQDLWHGVRIKPYPSFHNSAAHSDIQHSLQWDRNRRAVIPELLAVHLESEPAQMGANWKGRKTKRFGPEAQPVIGAVAPSFN